jgi:hypothetical protein
MDDMTEIERLRGRLEHLEAENARLARALSEGAAKHSGPANSSMVRARLDVVERQLTEYTEAYAAAAARAEAAENALDGVVSSPSWKITAPLRALKRRVRRQKS